MFELYKKEISTFFCSATGYLVVGVFLALTWLLLWVAPSELNIIYGGYATLAPLFDVAPWVYLFLVPAISMRLFAEEKRLGTLELLLIRPLRISQIVGAKYLAGLSLVLLSIAPSVVYVFIVQSLAMSDSGLDMGGVVGSYIALMLLASTYMSIGVCASALSDNQIVAFVSSAALCAVFYVGFDLLASVSEQSNWAAWVSDFGIANHYSSISRGVVDSRDVIYFASVVYLFFYITCLLVGRRK